LQVLLAFMPSQTRKRLTQAALELFVSQGVDNTTTREIANLANVNEATLFRQFGSKYGLLLAVIEESPLLANLETKLGQQFDTAGDSRQILRNYASVALNLFHQVPELIRSLVGESDQYSDELRRALKQKLAELNWATAQSLTLVMQSEPLDLPPEIVAHLLNALLLGHTVIELSSASQQEQDDFLQSLVSLFLPEAGLPHSSPETASVAAIERSSVPVLAIADLPPAAVHAILQRAKQAGMQDYALAYVLFGAGLSPTEIVSLQKADQFSDSQQYLLQVQTQQGIRQVPLNQWILGKRYGSHTNNPLTRWLKQRKDDVPALFLDADQPISEAKIQQHWHSWIENLPASSTPAVSQAQQTWYVEMLMRGISLENLSVLTGRGKAELQPYAQRAKQKMALEQALRLDRKPRSS
jgi:AcrR family transcriptional regulator